MTNAAVSVTQSVVEQFTEQYFRSLNCPIEKHGDKWEIVTTEEIDTELPTEKITLICGNDTADLGSDEEPLHPKSQLFQQILNEASKCISTGKISLDTENTEVDHPSWLQESNVTLNDAQFTPYYDRTAVVVLFKISIETVSKYQREFLRAIAIDTRSKEPLPGLEDTFLKKTVPERMLGKWELAKIDIENMAQLIDSARNSLVERVQPQINDIHQEASRAANAELEEYRQMQQQRIQELEEDLSKLSSRIDGLSETINSSEQEQRVRALKDRKQFKSEYDHLDTELTEIRQRRERGFPERQREIRERHALEVVTTPLTITQVEHERGEIEFELVEGENTQIMTLGYGNAVGITEEVYCSSCDRTFSEQNPLQTIKKGQICKKCDIGTV